MRKKNTRTSETECLVRGIMRIARQQNGAEEKNRIVLDGLRGEEYLDALLSRSDYVVLACPVNAKMVSMMNKDTLAKMKSSAVLIYVARGQVCVEVDLFAALKDGTIGRAVLDTWYQYPTPSDPNPKPSSYTLETLENVIMTPHCSAWSETQHKRGWA